MSGSESSVLGLRATTPPSLLCRRRHSNALASTENEADALPCRYQRVASLGATGRSLPRCRVGGCRGTAGSRRTSLRDATELRGILERGHATGEPQWAGDDAGRGEYGGWPAGAVVPARPRRSRNLW